MSKIHISKRRRPASWRLEPLPLDPRDRDIMRAKQLVGHSRPPGAHGAGPDRGGPNGEDGHA